MRDQWPVIAKWVDELRSYKESIEPHAVVLDGKRYGKAPLPFRRNQAEQPPIPGVKR